MMSKLIAQDDEQNKQFKPKIYQSKRRGQTRNFYDRCDRYYQNKYRSDSRDSRLSFSGRIRCRKITKIGQALIRTIQMTLEEVISQEI